MLRFLLVAVVNFSITFLDMQHYSWSILWNHILVPRLQLDTNTPSATFTNTRLFFLLFQFPPCSFGKVALQHQGRDSARDICKPRKQTQQFRQRRIIRSRKCTEVAANIDINGECYFVHLCRPGAQGRHDIQFEYHLLQMTLNVPCDRGISRVSKRGCHVAKG